jgi:hypothetical protein
MVCAAGMGMQVAKRGGIARARGTVACKLAVIRHPIWVDKSGFRWGKQAAGGMKKKAELTSFPWGTMGEVTALSVQTRSAARPRRSRDRFETPRSSHPIMRRREASNPLELQQA